MFLLTTYLFILSGFSRNNWYSAFPGLVKDERKHVSLILTCVINTRQLFDVTMHRTHATVSFRTGQLSPLQLLRAHAASASQTLFLQRLDGLDASLNNQ